jgi:hypothetical protein
MDTIERKSWGLSLAIHVALVVVSLFSFRLPAWSSRSASPPLPPAPTAAQHSGEVVLAPDAASGEGLGAFPALPPLSGQPAPSADVIVPASTSFPGKERSRGDRPGRSAPVDLPKASALSTPTMDALLGQRSNPTLSKDAANRATAADFVDFKVKQHYSEKWKGYASQITNRSLVVELVADEHAVIRRAALFHCTTGVADLDRAICDWLVEERTNLPPIPAGQALRFVVVLP